VAKAAEKGEGKVAGILIENQTALFKDKQWSGWKLFLDDLLHRESVQAAWQLSKHTFDTDFQSFMDDKIRESSVADRFAVRLMALVPVSVSYTRTETGVGRSKV